MPSFGPPYRGLETGDRPTGHGITRQIRNSTLLNLVEYITYYAPSPWL